MADLSAFDEGGAPAPSASLDKFVEMATRAEQLEIAIEELEGALKAQKSQLNELKTRELPEAMSEVGLNDFTLKSGTRIAVSDFVSGSIPKDPTARQVAFELLKAEGAEDLIKNVINIALGRSQHNEALNLIQDLREKGFDPEVKTDVHSQTLCAWVREKLRAGESLEYEKLGVFVGRTAKITLKGAK